MSATMSGRLDQMASATSEMLWRVQSSVSGAEPSSQSVMRASSAFVMVLAIGLGDAASMGGVWHRRREIQVRKWVGR